MAKAAVGGWDHGFVAQGRGRMRRCLAVLILLSGCRAQDRPARELPDRRLTPGAVVQVSLETMCAYGYTRTVRDVPLSEKRAVYREYGVAYNSSRYEVEPSSES